MFIFKLTCKKQLNHNKKASILLTNILTLKLIYFLLYYKYLNTCSGYSFNSLFLNLSISIHIASVSQLSSII